MKNILFLEEQFSLQGSTRALLDYAYYNEKLLKNKTFLAFGKRVDIYPWNEPYYKKYVDSTIDSLKTHFSVLEYKNYDEVEKYIADNEIYAMYNIKSGEPAGFASKKCKNLYHAVFPQHKSNIHGDRYAFVSKWLSDVYSGGQIPYVHHMINVPNIDKTEARKKLREKYNIPQDAFVYGRIGGYNDFNLQFVHNAVRESLNRRKDIYYFLICTQPFAQHERIIYVDPILDLKQKYEHIAVSDAMLHARHHGETFGLAIAEFCALNKPIITWKYGHGQGYVDILKNDAIYYKDYEELVKILINFVPDPNKDYNSYRDFTPEKIMLQFNEVFLKNL